MDSADIKDLRGKMGFSQTEFANEVGVTATMVSSWERGIHSPRQAKILRRLSDLKAEYFDNNFIPDSLK